MAQDSSLYVRRASVAAMKAHAALLALVPAGSIFGPQRPPNPGRPWVGYDVPPASVPFRASCLDGTDITARVQAYVETIDALGGEESALGLGNVIAALFDGFSVDLATYGCPFPAHAYYEWVSTQTLQGESADDWRAIISLRVQVAS